MWQNLQCMNHTCSFYSESANAVCVLVNQGNLPEMTDKWVYTTDLLQKL